MASHSVARSESIEPFIPELERLIAEAMDEWKVPSLALAVVQNGEVALVGAQGFRDVEAGLKVTTDTQFLISIRAARQGHRGRRLHESDLPSRPRKAAASALARRASRHGTKRVAIKHFTPPRPGRPSQR